MVVSPTKRNKMLSGMNTKDRTELDKAIASYTGAVTIVKPSHGPNHMVTGPLSDRRSNEPHI